MSHEYAIAAFDEISRATLRPQDIASGLLPWLKRIPDSHLSTPHITCMESIAEASDEELAALDIDADEDIVEAMGLLQEYAPPYTVVGAHEGDGSCFGCWPYVPEDDDEDLTRVADLSELTPGFVGEVLVVNERGNCTLMAVTGWEPVATEIWGMV